MKRLSLLLAGLVVMLGLSMTAFAQDTIKFNMLVGGDGSPTGLYQGTLNGVLTNFICADDTHEIQSGESWQATEYSLGTLLSSGAYAYVGYNSYYGSATAIWTDEAYLEYAIITGYSLTGAQQAAINNAIWDLTTPGGTELIGSTSDSTNPLYWINQAAANAASWASANPNGVNFFVPIIGTETGAPAGYPNPQLFSDVNTPEPVSMALMGTFLTLAGLGLNKKKLFT